MRFSNHFVRYALALVAAGLAFVLRIAIVHFVGPGLPTYITFYPFIMFVAIFEGLGPGLLATMASAIMVNYWVLAQGIFKFENAVDVVGQILFLGMGMLMSGAAERYRRDQKKSVEAIRLANNYNRNLIETSLDPLTTISAKGKITDVNQATIEVTGLSREKLIGTDFSDYFTEPERARQGYQQVFDKGLVSDYPLTIRRKDGKIIDVLYNAVVYKDDKGNVLGVFAAARDVTLLKKAETELEKARRLADIGTLAATVAHELRNPLAAIGLSAWHIKKMIKDPRIETDLNTIGRRISEADQIINNILSYSKIKISRFQVVKINSILKECIDEAMGRFPGQTIAVNVKIDRTEDLSIEADPLQMKEVFNNIINNAFDAINKNTGIIDVESCVNESIVSILIKDNGEGIEREHLKKIFDPFFTTKTKGTGLGLAVCNLAIRLHNGSITIESDKGKGTAVTITLPIRRQKDA